MLSVMLDEFDVAVVKWRVATAALVDRSRARALAAIRACEWTALAVQGRFPPELVALAAAEAMSAVPDLWKSELIQFVYDQDSSRINWIGAGVVARAIDWELTEWQKGRDPVAARVEILRGRGRTWNALEKPVRR
ncbi:MAG: hypothetical protein KIT58_05620 [Planctomycetota bacterium]|nr:hypothetical protein [Planctomycetota bacterium]